jgi:hypothetical protein
MLRHLTHLSMLYTARHIANDCGAASFTDLVLVVQGALSAPDTAGNPYGLMQKPPHGRPIRNRALLLQPYLSVTAAHHPGRGHGHCACRSCAQPAAQQQRQRQRDRHA